MRKLIVGSLLALAFFLAASPDVEAGCRRRGGRGLFRADGERQGLLQRLRDRRPTKGSQSSVDIELRGKS